MNQHVPTIRQLEAWMDLVEGVETSVLMAWHSCPFCVKIANESCPFCETIWQMSRQLAALSAISPMVCLGIQTVKKREEWEKSQTT